jgi:hypothetical protein
MSLRSELTQLEENIVLDELRRQELYDSLET